jgi:hypothetical protein
MIKKMTQKDSVYQKSDKGLAQDFENKDLVKAY